MITAKLISPAVGLLGALFCSLAIAVEFALGFHVRGLSLNVILGLSWLLVVAFALLSYRARGLSALLSAPVAAYILTSSSLQLAVACSLNSQSCP
jgi:hypothetical protein